MREATTCTWGYCNKFPVLLGSAKVLPDGYVACENFQLPQLFIKLGWVIIQMRWWWLVRSYANFTRTVCSLYIGIWTDKSHIVTGGVNWGMRFHGTGFMGNLTELIYILLVSSALPRRYS